MYTITVTENKFHINYTQQLLHVCVQHTAVYTTANCNLLKTILVIAHGISWLVSYTAELKFHLCYKLILQLANLYCASYIAWYCLVLMSLFSSLLVMRLFSSFPSIEILCLLFHAFTHLTCDPRTFTPHIVTNTMATHLPRIPISFPLSSLVLPAHLIINHAP